MNTTNSGGLVHSSLELACYDLVLCSGHNFSSDTMPVLQGHRILT